jgi:alpha-1,6-mannosyltransferase
MTVALAPAPLRLATQRPLRVVDVAVFYGHRSGGIRTYLDAKVAYARESGAFEHHLIIPGVTLSRRTRGASTIHTLPSISVATSNGYRWPLGTRPLATLLRDLKPDVVLTHDPFWGPTAARAGGGRFVAVHHGSPALDAAAAPCPALIAKPLIGALMKRVDARADAVMSAWEDAIPLRFGLDPAMRPEPALRGDHVLYAGRLAREKGVDTLLDAMARADWELRLVGAGTAAGKIAAQVKRLKLSDRVTYVGHLADREALAQAYREARCVVMPGPLETFGLVAYEAAACGAPAVACSTAPSAQLCGPLVETFKPYDADDLLRAITRARALTPDPAVAAAFADAHRWEDAFAAELADLEELVS